ncbi:MAG: metal-dependent transcriptional regulator [Clostridia bacterium]|nr:metal-dependent transcriptional regulator [Clostridia bacterium]
MKKTTEDYLKTIRLIQLQNGKVRSVDLVGAFGVSRPTVSNIVKRLSDEGFISPGFRYGIRLTESGLALADKMIERNRVIRELLVSAGVDPAVAEADACEIEHAVSDQSLNALKSIGIILRTAGEK